MEIRQKAPDRGQLRIYLGAAPGVGKTYAMLDEGNRRLRRGTDVVIGCLDTHGRPGTQGQIGSLDFVHTARSTGTSDPDTFDIEATLLRAPAAVLIDDLASPDSAGSMTCRWHHLDELLDAGIDVVTTLNITDIDSLRDVSASITGTRNAQTVPDEVVRGADQIELVDMSPEALRRRLAHGNIFPADQINAELGHYFQPSTLAALRELALLWVADRVEESRFSDFTPTLDTVDSGRSAPVVRDRIVVVVSGLPGGETVIRRASQLALKARTEIIGVRVVHGNLPSDQSDLALEEQRQSLRDIGASYHEVVGVSVADSVVGFAQSHNATQLVIGKSASPSRALVSNDRVVAQIVNRSTGFDVHVVSVDGGHHEVKLEKFSTNRDHSPRRRLATLTIGAALLMLISIVQLALNNRPSLSTTLLIFLGVCVLMAAFGGILVGSVLAVAAIGIANYYFVAPVHTWRVANVENVVDLAVFLSVTTTVSVLTNRANQRSLEARRARAETEALARTTAILGAEHSPLAGLISHIRSTFNFDSVAILEGEASVWRCTEHDGEPVPSAPNLTGSWPLDTRGTVMLVVTGGVLDVESRRVLGVFADQVRVALAARQLQQVAAQADAIAQADALRTALLRAVSHDLRTPLSSIKASVSSLLSTDVNWSDEDRLEFLGTIDSQTDRLNRLVGDLLDMSRLQGGALTIRIVPTALDEVIGSALASIAPVNVPLTMDIHDDLPFVAADPVLLERALANIISNAIQWTPPDHAVRVTAGSVGQTVQILVQDRGPGIPHHARQLVFEPFQRLNDQRSTGGVGLGLALSKGFVTAMHGTLHVDDTPGGGCTMVIELPSVTIDLPTTAEPVASIT